MMPPRPFRSAVLSLFASLVGTVLLAPTSPASTADGTWGVLVAESPAGPVARFGHTAIYDPVGDRMVVFGGQELGGGTLRNDVWALTLSGTPVWSQVIPGGTAPGPRWFHSAIYDAARGRMIVFGGMDYTSNSSDVWALALADPPTWTQLTPAGTPPAARSGHTAIHDPSRDRMVVFGGTSSQGELADAWALSLGDAPVWTQITLPPCPTHPDCPGTRAHHVAIHDAAGDRMLLYGGLLDFFHDGGEFWALTLSDTPAWVGLPGTEALRTDRIGATAIRDPVRDRMVVFGGQDGFVPGEVNTTVAASLDASSSWTWLAPGGSPPSARMFHTAVYDPVRDRMVVFGGDAGSTPGRTWALTWGDPVVPVQLALVCAEAEPGLVKLMWYAASGTVTATVYRRTETSEWSALGTVVSDGTGQLVYEDRGVSAGTRYGYRLGVTEAGAETYLGEAWVDVPVAAGLALAGVRPNPATSELSVAFGLPDPASPGARSPARLEAYDLAGRRVAGEDVGALGAGHHVVKLGEGARLGCGVYVVRLTQGGRTLTTRAVIVR